MTFQPQMTCCRIHREFHYQHFAIMASKVKHNDPVLPSHYKLNEPIPGPIYSEEWLQRVAQMPPCFFLEQVWQFQSWWLWLWWWWWWWTRALRIPYFDTNPYPTLDDGWKSFLGQKFRLNRSKIRSTPVLPLLLLLFFKQMFLANGDRLSVRSAIGFAHMAHGMGWLLEVWISAVVSF